tara:strand:- start:2078 stop:2485 length:408 start_codon:yes stop_codon:yes gene_type:complete
MTNDLHAALQAPLVLVIVMAGLITLYRGKKSVSGSPLDRSAMLQVSIGVMLIALGLKQMFWQIFWAMRATGSGAISSSILDVTWIATIINIGVIAAGAVVCVLASRTIVGTTNATTGVVGMLVAVTAASAVMVTR